MSFDVYAQRFVGREPADADSTVIRQLVAPHLGSTDPRSDFAQLVFEDGTADLYGIEDPGSGFMVNHTSGEQVWDLLAQVAVQAGMTLAPVGVPPMIPTEAARQDLPEDLADEAVVVTSGADILRTISEA